MAKNWIQGATSNAHGQFKAKAQRAGMSTRAFASKEADTPGKTGAQARLAKTLMGMKKGGSVTTRLPGMDKPAMMDNPKDTPAMERRERARGIAT